MSHTTPLSLFLFEDREAVQFHPLTLTRPLDDLRIGICTIREKWERVLNPSAVTRTLRDNLQGVFEAPALPDDQECLLINSRLLPDPELVAAIQALQAGEGLSRKGVLLAGRTDGKSANRWLNEFPADPASHFSLREETSAALIHFVWNLFKRNGEEIRRDISLLKPVQLDPTARVADSAVLQNRSEIYIGKHAVIEPGAILMADRGPIYIGEGATVMAGAILRGGTAVCAGSEIKMGARIYGNTTVGPVCKVGGEVNNVIFHSYSNKAHDGYAGNSVFGQWCNLGADSNTSNLKNNYGTVQFLNWNTGNEEETGEIFMGTIMADHSKTGINAMLNTGTNCGVCCNLFSDGYPPKHVPSFSWVNGSRIDLYQFDKAVETMRRTMARRGVTLTDSYIGMMRGIFETRENPGG
ncbi:MAG: putative sugar nucleotidyl transferase [Balneolaceae bacterium]